MYINNTIRRSSENENKKYANVCLPMFQDSLEPENTRTNLQDQIIFPPSIV